VSGLELSVILILETKTETQKPKPRNNELLTLVILDAAVAPVGATWIGLNKSRPLLVSMARFSGTCQIADAAQYKTRNG